MEKKKNKKKNLFITIGLIGVLLLIGGVTYAYWILTKEQTGENVVNSACLNMDIESESDDISLDKAYPILDSEGRKLKPYKFSVHNKCSDMATYQINLESLSKVLEANRLNPDYLKVKLNEVGQEGIEKVLGETSSTDTTIENTYEAHKLMDGYLEANETKDFELRIWMHEKVTVENADSMNKEFKSKITVTSTYINEDDVPPTSSLALSVCENTITATATAIPYKDKSISKYEYKIDEEDWQDGKEIQEFDNLENKIHEIKLRVTDNKGAVSEEISQSIEVNYNVQTVNIGEMQIPIVTSECKNNGLYETTHDDLEELGQEWNKTEYRYGGPHPNNYVSFNNELWRIIGLVNVKNDENIEQRIKIVRTNGIESQKDFDSYAWDNDVDYTNNWTTSKLKDMLNGIYYESGTGDCYTGIYNGSTSSQDTCDFNSGVKLPKGLDELAKNMIDKEVIWNIGGHNDAKLIANKFYEKERGTNTGKSNTYPSEWSNETDVGEKHNGIGLIYPSDYGYSVGGNVRSKCFTKTLFYYSSDNCDTNNWLRPNNYLWLLTPNLESSGTTEAFRISKPYAYVDISGYVSYAYEVWPTLYLNKNVTIISGEGTMEQPYQLQLNA